MPPNRDIFKGTRKKKFPRRPYYFNFIGRLHDIMTLDFAWYFQLMPIQGLTQKEKVQIDCEKSAQISIFTKQDCNTMMTQYSH